MINVAERSGLAIYEDGRESSIAIFALWATLKGANHGLGTETTCFHPHLLDVNIYWVERPPGSAKAGGIETSTIHHCVHS